MRRVPLLSSTPAASVALALTLASAPAHAHEYGFAVPGCDSCHNGASKAAVSLKLSPESPAPGDTVTLDVAIQSANGKVGGLYVLTDDRGRLVNVAGQGTRLINESQIVHSAPKQAIAGAVHFTVKWVAPTTAGGVVIKVWGVSANGDHHSEGDGAGFAALSFAYGCPGTTYYADPDGDGYGTSDDQVVDCTQPPLHSAKSGDCNENSAAIHPGRDEICNGKDDDCDGQIDEDLQVAAQYEDADGDGHGSLKGATVMAECPPAGYAPTQDDCDDTNPDIYVGAPESCNYIDDSCDGRIDEGVREVCGIGLCARVADSCGLPALCTPGQPSEEKCNLLDDDCNGEVDEDTDLCGAGAGSKVCKKGACVSGSIAAPEETGEGTGAGSNCAVNPRSATPWGMLTLFSPLIAASWRRWRRPGRRRPPR